MAIKPVSEVAENDQAIITTVVHLISSGQVRLCDEAMEAMRHRHDRDPIGSRDCRGTTV